MLRGKYSTGASPGWLVGGGCSSTGAGLRDSVLVACCAKRAPQPIQNDAVAEPSTPHDVQNIGVVFLKVFFYRPG